MSAVRIIGARNPVNQIEFEIEVGDAEILAFTVPKLQYIPNAVMAKYEPWLEDWQKRAADASDEGAEARKSLHTYDAALKLLEWLLPKPVFAKIDALTAGEKTMIEKAWSEQSEVTAGESVASDNS